jgi:hypothetical protein
MRININLASQKYEDAGEFYFRWGTALALALIVTVGLAFLGWRNFQRSVDARKRINELHDKIRKADEDRAHGEAVLNRPENQDVRDQSRFWNDVIDQKLFSWTRLLSDLEKIMPGRAYVESVQPMITSDKRLQLRLIIAGEKLNDAEELVKRMERSEHFRSTVIGAELPPHSQTTGGPQIAEFEILTYYAPPAQTQQQHTTAIPQSRKPLSTPEADADSAEKQGAS